MLTIEEQLRRYGDFLDEVFEAGGPDEAAVYVEPLPSRRRGRLVLTGAAVVVLALVAFLARPGDDTSVTASHGATVALLPSTIPDLVGVATDASIVGDPTVLVGPTTEPAPADELVEISTGSVNQGPDAVASAVGGRPATRSTTFGALTYSFSIDGIRAVVRAGAAVHPRVLEEIAAGLVVVDGRVKAGPLPDGWAVRWDGFPRRPTSVTEYQLIGEHAAGAPFLTTRATVQTWRDAPAGGVLGMRSPVGATSTTVRGHPGYLSTVQPDDPAVWWTESDGLVVFVQVHDDVAGLRRFVDDLRPGDQADWQALQRRTPPSPPPAEGVTTTSVEAPPGRDQAYRTLLALAEFARAPGPDTYDRLGLGDGTIALVLDDQVVATKPAAQLASPIAWRLPSGESLLVRLHALQSDAATLDAGPLQACNAHGAAPAGLAYDVWLVVDPQSVNRCADDWVGAGVFVRDGKVVGIAVYVPH